MMAPAVSRDGYFVTTAPMIGRGAASANRVIPADFRIIRAGMTTRPLDLSSLRFSCTGCGACCMGRGEHFVEASRAEQRRIQRFLGVTWRWFRRRYVTRYADGTEGLRWQRD